MALVVYDRVQETTATTGTGTITLGGAVAGFQSFAVVGNGNTTFYCILNGSNWEVGIGTYSTAGPTLARTTVLSNSLGTTSPINLVGDSTVFVTYPAGKSVNEDASGAVNILTYVPNTTTTIGTLNVGDGTYSYSSSGQIATFAAADPVVNGINIQNTSTSNTAYSAIQIGADNLSTGYYLQIGTNSSTYDYAAAGYPNSSINQPNTHYILANRADLGIATWDADDIHFIQNASVATTDSMTLYASGGLSLGGLGNPGLGNVAVNNSVVGVTTITSAGGITTLTAASTQVQIVTGTLNQTIRLPDATTLLRGTFYTLSNASTGILTIQDNAGTVIETITTGGAAQALCISVATIAGSWGFRVFAASNVTWGNANLDYNGTITSAVWNGTTVASGYGGTGLTTFTAANNALYSTSASALTAGTLPVAAGGTAATTFTANGVIYGNGTSALGATTAGTTGQVLIATTSGAPSWGSVPSTAAVTSFSAGTTGFTPSSDTTGVVTLAGTLNVANGGTGLTSLTAGYIPFGNGTSAFGNSANLFWDNTNARLGIGSTTPRYKLDIFDESNATFGFTEYNNSDGPTIRLFRAGGTIASPTAVVAGYSLGGLRAFGYTGAAFGSLSAAIDLVANQTFAVGSQGSYIQFRTTADSTASSTEKMRITGDGNVGIGSTTPSVKLYVNANLTGGTSNSIRLLDDGAAATSTSNNSYGYGFNATTGELSTTSGNGGFHSWYTANTERMRIDSSGNVGIGTSSPSSKLFVSAAQPTNYEVGVIQNTGAGAYSLIRWINSGGATADFGITDSGTNAAIIRTGGTERMRIDSSGNVGIDNAAPGVKLDVVGTIRSSSAAVASASTITPTAGTTNQYNVTALATPATIAAPSGTPIDGQKLTIRIKDDGTGRALTWTTTSGAYRVIGTTLPTTTTASKTVYVGCVYNAADVFWDVVAVATQA
jgi:hypothetical protein